MIWSCWTYINVEKGEIPTHISIYLISTHDQNVITYGVSEKQWR